MTDDLSALFHTIGTVVGALTIAGGGAAAIGYGVFKWLGEKWLDNKFRKELQAYRHEQVKELEQLRFRINALMDRTVKLHQREFDTIPEAWAMLVGAFRSTRGLLSPYQEYPDLDRMSEAQLEQFLANSPLQSWQHDELKQAARKLDYYAKAIMWYRYSNVAGAWSDLNDYLTKNGIFMPREIKSKFKQVDDLIWEALNEFKMNEQAAVRPRDRVAAEALGNVGEPLLRSLEDDVANRLWSLNQLAPADALSGRAIPSPPGAAASA